MMNIQEMATAAENQLDVKIILLNNEALGLVHQQQSLFYQQGVFAATYPGMINFMQIAAGFGLQTCDLNNEVDPQAALQAIIDRPGPIADPRAHRRTAESVSDGTAGCGQY